MTILIVSTSANSLSSFQVDDKGHRKAIVQTIDNIVNPLPLSISGDPKSHDLVSTDWIIRHPTYSLVYALTSFGGKAKSMLTTYRVYKDGSLEELSNCPSGGYQACHAAIHPSNNTLAICHLHCGRVSIFDVQDDVGCLGPPRRVVRLPVVYPFNLLHPHMSSTGLGVPAAHGVSFCPSGEFMCIAEPSQHAVLTYRCDAETGQLITREAYKSKIGLPPSNSAFSYVQTQTEFDAVTMCQQIAIRLGGDWGPRVTRAVVHPSGLFVYALQEQSNSVSVYAVHHDGMILPNLLQELKVADMNSIRNSSPVCCAVATITAVTDLQAFDDGLILAVSGGTAAENGIRIIHYVDDGSRLKLGQHISTPAPVRHFCRDADERTLWVGFQSEFHPYVQKYERQGKWRSMTADYNGYLEDVYEFVGQANVGMEVQCLVTLDEFSLAPKPKPRPRSLSSLPPAAAQLTARPGMQIGMVRRARLRASFLERDTDRSGYLEAREVAEMLKSMGEPCNPDDVKEFIKKADKNQDGKLDFEEFYTFATGEKKQKSSSRLKKERSTGSLSSSGGSSRRLRSEKPQRRFQDDRRRKLKAAFDRRDDDGSGYLEVEEVAKILADLGLSHSNDAVRDFMEKVDQDGDGRIDFEEFCIFASGESPSGGGGKKGSLAKAPKPQKATPEYARRQTLKKNFDKKDLNKSGYLELKEVAIVLNESGESCSPRDVAEFMKMVDKDGDGRVDFEEFYSFATGYLKAQGDTGGEMNLSEEIKRRKEFKAAFDGRDSDGSGYLELEEVTLVLAEIGQSHSREDVEQFMKDADQDGDGLIDFEEFYLFAVGKSKDAEVNTKKQRLRAPRPKKSTPEYARRQLLKKEFDQRDLNSSGYLELKDVTKVLAASGEECNPKVVAAFMKLVDKDGDGRIDFEEFYAFATGQVKLDDADPSAAAVGNADEMLKRKTFKAAFDAQDADESGYLEAEEVSKVLRGMGQEVSPQELADFMKEVDRDGDGRIDFEEFYIFASGQAYAAKPKNRLKAPKPKKSSPEYARRKKLKKEFDKRDANKSGYLEMKEVTKVLAASGEACSAKDVAAFMTLVDKDGDGRIDFEEFYAFATGHVKLGARPLGNASVCSNSEKPAPTDKLLKRRAFKAAFDAQDDDGSGYLEKEEVSRALAEIGQEQSPEELQEFMEQVDRDGDGRIDFEEFYLFASGNAEQATDNRRVRAPKPKKSSSEYARRKMLKKEFNKRDLDKSGYLEMREVTKLLAASGEPCSAKDVAAFLKLVDRDGDCRIDFEEFYAFATGQVSLRAEAPTTPANTAPTPVAEFSKMDELSKRKALKKAFDAEDSDRSGYLELSDVERVLKQMGQPIKHEMLGDFMKQIDQDGDGRIDFEEFYLFASGKMKDKSKSKKRLKAPKPKKSSPEYARRKILKKQFDKRDLNKSGYLEITEVAKVLTASNESCSAKDISAFMKLVDTDHDGRVDFEEFYAFATGHVKLDGGGAPNNEQDELLKRATFKAAFEAEDDDGSGYLEPEEVAKALKEMGQPVDPQELADFMQVVDQDGDGRIDFEEFYLFASGQAYKSKPKKRIKAPKPKKTSPEYRRRKILKKEFDKRDVNKSGFLELSEVTKVLIAAGESCSAKDVAAFMKLVDKDRDGRVDFEEFYAFATGQVKLESAEDKDLRAFGRADELLRRSTFKAAFDAQDDDGSGYLEEKEVLQVLKEMGQDTNEQDLTSFMKEVDQDGDGRIDFEEFYLFASGKGGADMKRINAPKPEKSSPEYLRRLELKQEFDKRDAKRNGYLDLSEVTKVLASSGIASAAKDVAAFMKLVDSDRDGRVDFEEFYAFATGHVKLETDTAQPSPRSTKRATKDMLQRRTFKAAFDAQDDDGSGYLEAEEVSRVLAELGQAQSPEEVNDFMEQIDQDGDGRIDFEEFYLFASGKLNEASDKQRIKAPKPKKSSPEYARRKILMKEFNKRDVDNSGYLELREVTKVLAASGEPCSVKDVAAFMSLVDMNRDGRIDFEEFYAFATGQVGVNSSDETNSTKS